MPMEDFTKANELNLQAGELGCADGYYMLAYSYRNGSGVDRDMKKAEYYLELSTIWVMHMQGIDLAV